MKEKILALLFLALFAMPAFAAIVPVINNPQASITWNNLPANQRTVDINFTVGDDNTSVTDLNVEIYYHSTDELITTGTAITTDGNLFDWGVNPTSTGTCTGTSDWETATCSVHWTLPNNATLGDDDYFIDVGVKDVETPSLDIHVDANVRSQFTIETSIPNAAAVQSLMSIVGLTLAGIVLLMGLGAILFLKTDLVKTTIMTIVAAIVVAIGAMIIGVVMAML